MEAVWGLKACFELPLGWGPVEGFPAKNFKISMLKDAMTGHLAGCGGADLFNLLTSASAT